MLKLHAAWENKNTSIRAFLIYIFKFSVIWRGLGAYVACVFLRTTTPLRVGEKCVEHMLHRNVSEGFHNSAVYCDTVQKILSGD